MLDLDELKEESNAIMDFDLFTFLQDLLTWQNSLIDDEEEDAITYSVLDGVIDLALSQGW